MKLFFLLSIVSLSILSEGMVRTPSSELKQRTSKTVSSQNRLTRTTSTKLEKMGQAIKKSTSLTSLNKLASSPNKSPESSSKQELSSSKERKLKFEVPFIDRELLRLTTNYDQQAETALMDGDAKKFQELYKQIESPRAKQQILAKAKQFREFDPQFCHVLVLLSNEKESK